MTRATSKFSAPAQPGRSTKTAHKVASSLPAQTPPAAGRSDNPGAAENTAQQGGKKEKRHRVAHRMTKEQSALLDQLKSRSLRLGHTAKKGDVIVAGLQLLRQLSEKGFEAAILPVINMPMSTKNSASKKAAGRPGK